MYLLTFNLGGVFTSSVSVKKKKKKKKKKEFIKHGIKL